MRETQFQKQVKKQLEQQTAFIIKIHGEAFQIRGLPDLFVIHRKWTGFLELKTEKNKCSTIQRIIAAKIELRGMPIFVLRCIYFNEQYQYQLENFEGKIIETFFCIQNLLNILIEKTLILKY